MSIEAYFREVGPKNIEQSYGGLLRISPNIVVNSLTGSTEELTNMGFAEVETKTPASGEAGFGNGLAKVSDSNGTYSCLSLGTAAAKIEGEVQIGFDDATTERALMVYGGIELTGDLKAAGDLTADSGSFENGLYASGEISIKGHRIELLPEDSGSTIRSHIDFTPKPNCVIWCNPETMAYEPYDFNEIMALIKAMQGEIEDMKKLFDTRYIRQDEQGTVRCISSVDEYPGNPDAYTLYLKKEH